MQRFLFLHGSGILKGGNGGNRKLIFGGFEQLLIDGDAEYLVVFGDEYVGDADVALEIKQGHNRDNICKIISKICKEDYIHKGSDSLKVYTEGEAYIIMDGTAKIGKVTTFDRKFGVVLRFYWSSEVNESGSFSHEDSYYEYEEPAETGEEKRAGSLSHRAYYYDASEEIPEDDDGLTPLRSYTYEAVEE